MNRECYLEHYRKEKAGYEKLIKTLKVFQMSSASINLYEEKLAETSRIVEQLEEEIMRERIGREGLTDLDVNCGCRPNTIFDVKTGEFLVE